MLIEHKAMNHALDKRISGLLVALFVGGLSLEAAAEDITGLRSRASALQPFSTPLAQLPITKGNTPANKDLLKYFIAKDNDPAASGNGIVNDPAALTSPMNKAKSTFPSVAYFANGARAGKVTVTPSGDVNFQDKESGARIDLGKDDRFKALPSGYPISFGVEADAKKEIGAQRKFFISTADDAMKPHGSSYWNDSLEYPLGPKAAAKFQQITQAKEELASVFQKLKSAGVNVKTTLSDKFKLQQELGAKETKVINALATAYANETDPGVKQRLVEQVAVHEDGLKAVMGNYVENYHPAVYDMIAATTRACGAIQFEGDSSPIVSAALIADDAILTCRHGIVDKWKGVLNDSAADHTLTIAYFIPNREMHDGVIGIGDPIPITELLEEGSEWTPNSGHILDFAIFRINSTKLTEYISRAKAQCTPENGRIYYPTKPFLLAAKMPVYQSPLIVIGHPNGETKLVHDSTHLIFPPTADSTTLARMEMAFNARLQNTQPAYQVQRKDGWNAFLKKYYQQNEAGAQHVYLKDSMPIFGLDCSTFHGDSGAPVFDRTFGHLVGVFKGSAVINQSEEDQPPTNHFDPVGVLPDFDHHEIAVPISAIVQQLDAVPGKPWRTKIKGLRFGSTVMPNE